MNRAKRGRIEIWAILHRFPFIYSRVFWQSTWFTGQQGVLGNIQQGKIQVLKCANVLELPGLPTPAARGWYVPDWESCPILGSVGVICSSMFHYVTLICLVLHFRRHVWRGDLLETIRFIRGKNECVPAIVPECVARVPVSLWRSGGWGCVRQTLRNRPQPFATRSPHSTLDTLHFTLHTLHHFTL